MNSTKSALLKRHYKRQRMILNAKRLVIQTGSLRRSQFILDQPYKLAGLLPILDIEDEANQIPQPIYDKISELIDENKYALNSGASIMTEGRTSMTKEQYLGLMAQVSEIASINTKTPIWGIAITIAIAVGVYLWLK